MRAVHANIEIYRSEHRIVRPSVCECVLVPQRLSIDRSSANPQIRSTVRESKEPTNHTHTHTHTRARCFLFVWDISFSRVWLFWSEKSRDTCRKAVPKRATIERSLPTQPSRNTKQQRIRASLSLSRCVSGVCRCKWIGCLDIPSSDSVVVHQKIDHSTRHHWGKRDHNHIDPSNRSSHL